jgi:hypothetical protein
MSDDPGEYPPQPREPETGAEAKRTTGLFVLTHESFAPARPLWNQHAYHVSNVNDDLIVPSRPTAPWLAQLGMRQQALPPPIQKVGPAPDLTARVDAPECGGDRFVLRGAICNRGPLAIGAGAPATFYDGPPDRGGNAFCTTPPAGALAPGQCQEVTCASVRKPTFPVSLYLRVGDDGKGGRTEPQCTLGNDLAARPDTTCTAVD